MTYSIVVTILLIIFVTLFIVNIRASVTTQDAISRKLKCKEEEANMLSRKVCQVLDVKETLERQKAHLECSIDSLQERIDGKSQFIATQRDRMKHLRKRNDELLNELLMVSDLIHIKFTALLPDGQPVKTLFKLGLGPCGLHVKSLRWTELEDRYLIDQLCTNGERKQFIYYKNEVVGRIEFRHGKV
ncbi:unknown function [Klebsiella phage vB_Ko_K26PH128C1]|uniref:Fusion protein n=1 Tax=Klebsiella phage vB_Ko_K26PH128C1 TaxID=3071634 RepID=A0AAV1ME72_9CAUD|nr:unknown function [Klebsiella phage vB_Ko_K26PH128C1]